VRILIPDHPDLNVGGAVSFAAEMRDTADPATYETGAEPWTLPATLTTPALATAMEAILLLWGYDVGDESRDTAIDLHHAGVQHMGVYVATATRAQLDQLTAARDVMTSATNTPHTQRSPQEREFAEFVDAYNDATGDDEVSLRAWNVMLDLFAVATATTPTTTHRPERLLDDGLGTPIQQSLDTPPGAFGDMTAPPRDATSRPTVACSAALTRAFAGSAHRVPHRKRALEVSVGPAMIEPRVLPCQQQMKECP
jgi:hypothetical protein